MRAPANEREVRLKPTSSAWSAAWRRPLKSRHARSYCFFLSVDVLVRVAMSVCTCFGAARSGLSRVPSRTISIGPPRTTSNDLEPLGEGARTRTWILDPPRTISNPPPGRSFRMAPSTDSILDGEPPDGPRMEPPNGNTYAYLCCHS